MLNKYEITVDNEKFTVDQMAWDYPQTDSEASGATDDNVMYRDVLPRRMKFTVKFEKPSEELASKILLMRKKKSCVVDFWDLETRTRKVRTMYPTSDQVEAKMLSKNEDFICDDIEIRFTQMIPDELV